MAAVQFFGKKAVLEAFKYREIDAWGIFDGREFMAGGEGEEELSEYLTMLESHGSAATYRLKVYKDCEDTDDLTDKDPCSGSFKFKLSEAGAGRSAGQVGGYIGGGDIVMQKMHGIISAEVSKVLEKKFLGKGDDEPEEETWEDVAMGLLKNPEKLAQTIGMIKNLLNPGAPVHQMPVQLAAVGKVERVGSNQSTTMSDEQLEQQAEQVAAVLDRLEKADPKILQHLTKLADIAEKKPDTFRFLLNTLEGM